MPVELAEQSKKEVRWRSTSSGSMKSEEFAFKSTGSSLREALASGVINREDEERDSAAKYDIDSFTDNERDSAAKYDIDSTNNQ